MSSPALRPALLGLLCALLILPPSSRPALAQPREDPATFAAWLADYRAAAVSRGLSADDIDRTLTGVRFLPQVVALDRNQPDDSGADNRFAAYLARQLTAERIEDGQRLAMPHRATLKRLGAAEGVPPAILAAIWGMESSYGRVTGNTDLPSALATLAFDGRREALFTRELDALVRIVGEGRAPRAALRGSWAGAFGQPQFLPSSYLAHGRDGNGDGRVDLWGSEADSFASIARYLQASGWREGVGWGFRALVPRGFDRQTVANPERPTTCIRPLERHSRWLPAGEWRRLGFVALNAPWPTDDEPMSLVEPDGPGRGAFLTTHSYRALMAYNCSNFYALSVALLADALQPTLGAPTVMKPNPPAVR